MAILLILVLPTLIMSCSKSNENNKEKQSMQQVSAGTVTTDNNNNKLNELKKKQENSSKNGYLKGAIKTWTERDPLKLEYAKKFNLNYLVFWNINEFNKWIDENYRRKI